LLSIFRLLLAVSRLLLILVAPVRWWSLVRARRILWRPSILPIVLRTLSRSGLRIRHIVARIVRRGTLGIFIISRVANL
jgi:hypothetical protein